MKDKKAVKIKNFERDKFLRYGSLSKNEKDMWVNVECPFCGQEENQPLSDKGNWIHVCDCGECCAVMTYYDGIAEISGFKTR